MDGECLSVTVVEKVTKLDTLGGYVFLVFLLCLILGFILGLLLARCILRELEVCSVLVFCPGIPANAGIHKSRQCKGLLFPFYNELSLTHCTGFLCNVFAVFIGHSIFYPHPPPPPYGRHNLAVFETAVSEYAVSIIRKRRNHK